MGIDRSGLTATRRKSSQASQEPHSLVDVCSLSRLVHVVDAEGPRLEAVCDVLPHLRRRAISDIAAPARDGMERNTRETGREAGRTQPRPIDPCNVTRELGGAVGFQVERIPPTKTARKQPKVPSFKSVTVQSSQGTAAATPRVDTIVCATA